MAEIATAFVTLMPSARGFGSSLDRQIGGDVDRSGKRQGGRFGVAMAGGLKTGAAVGAVAVGALVKSAVGLEAAFSKTMNVLQATTGASSAEMRQLSSLAIKMGADTVFSAGDASQAMLELARGGLTPAAIQAGALQGTLTLAAAGELQMGEAANIAVKSMGQFNLAGKDMGAIAAALAGGANASSASVSDMSQALAQGGLAANSVGFSIQETTGILAAFSNAGLEGSDAGTSLKTTLDRLQPASGPAKDALKELGIVTRDGANQFLRANGEFKSAAQIAGVLQKATAGLSDAERKRLITAAFGSDAQRGATILAQEGAAGIMEMVKATSDQSAAESQAAANMKGTAGALEQLSGAWETLRLQVGLAIQPLVQGALGLLSSGIGAVIPLVEKASGALQGLGSGGAGLSGFVGSLKSTGTAVMGFIRSLLPTIMSIGRNIGAVLGPAFRDIGNLIQTQFLPAFQRILPVVAPIAKFLLSIFGAAVVGALKGVVQAVKGIITFISGVFNIISALFTGDWPRLWQGLTQVVSGVVNTIVGVVRAFLNIGILAIFRRGVLSLRSLWTGLWNGLRGIATSAGNALRGAASRIFAAIVNVIRGAVRGYVNIWRGAFQALLNIARNGLAVLRSAFGGVLAAIRTIVAQSMARVRSAFVSAWNAVRSATVSAFGRIRSAVSTGVTNALRFVRDMPGRAASAISGGASAMYNAGTALIAGLVRGVAAKIGEAVAAVQNGLSRIRGMLPGSPIKWGPLKSWNNGGAGRRLMDMLASGLSDTRSVDAAMQRLTSRMSVADLTTDIRATTSGLATTAIPGSSTRPSGFSGTLYVGDRPMDVWFEENFDTQMALAD